MSTKLATTPKTKPGLDAAITAALDRIPPLWPLDHFVAVNPFLGLLDQPFAKACQKLRQTVGAAPVQSAAEYLVAWKVGAITREDLELAADEKWTADLLIAALEEPDSSPLTHPIATVADLIDQTRPHAHWSVFVVEEIAKWCAVALDTNQTTWNSPWKTQGLYAAWKHAAEHDRNPESFGLPGFRAFVAGLPSDATAAIHHCMAALDPQVIDLTDFLHRQLATIAGWAGYAKYLVREDELRGRENSTLRELLAIRLAYDAALFEGLAKDGLTRAEWRHAAPPVDSLKTFEVLSRWQHAYEIGYQRQLALKLTARPGIQLATRPAAQAVFCIDVRSEVVRRHLEAAMPGIQTIGFAGFFGFPVSHETSDKPAPGARCPVLLVPPVRSRDHDAHKADQKLLEKGAWKAFQNSAASCFSFVESLGLTFAPKLAGKENHDRHGCCEAHPELVDLDTKTKADLAQGALKNMSLTDNFARLVLICGHGSHSVNNPYASSLDCGACGGHAGDVNARLAADTLNDPAVRAELAARGLVIPEDTHFLAGLHHTLSDDFTLFGEGHIPTSHRADLAELKRALDRAGLASRREKAPTLGISEVDDRKIAALIRGRATDPSQVRPEWGLANNAALVAAPRSRTHGLKLDGRVFLHDYDAAKDPEDQVLNLILCAPVVVASWINLQYYASRTSPAHFGSGNKAIHHVVGGIGVMEGNQGDLKVGLPLQSIHNGERFVHEPRRLTVFIEAAQERIDAVLAKNPDVARLFDHGWIHLVSLQDNNAHRRMPDGWQLLASY